MDRCRGFHLGDPGQWRRARGGLDPEQTHNFPASWGLTWSCWTSIWVAWCFMLRQATCVGETGSPTGLLVASPDEISSFPDTPRMEKDLSARAYRVVQASLEATGLETA